MLLVIEQTVAYMKEAGIAKSRFWAYMLVQDVAEAEKRAMALSQMGMEPFAPAPGRSIKKSRLSRKVVVFVFAAKAKSKR